MDTDCTIYKTSNIIGKKWTILILLELYKGAKKIRYTKLKESVHGITAKILAERLRELEKEEMIKKDIDTTSFPIKSEYSLTPAGEDFIKIIKSIKAWALKHKYKNQNCMKNDCKNCKNI